MGGSQFTVEDAPAPQFTVEDEQPNAGKPASGGMPPVTIDMRSPADRMVDWFHRKKEDGRQQRLKDAAAGKGDTGSNVKDFLLGAGEDTANLFKSVASPKGIATTAAAVAAPEVAVPYFAATGAKDMLTPRSADETQADALQRRLMGASQVVGAGAGAEAIRQGAPTATGKVADWVKEYKAAAAAKAADFSNDHIVKALPPTKSANYAPEDLQRSRPYLEDAHKGAPINSVESFRDAADTKIGEIDDKIKGYIAANPQDTIAGHATPLADVKAALAKNITKGFTEEGLKAIEKFPVSDDMTVEQADAVRHQLNAENRAAMKSKNNYDLQNMRQTDAGFAAREALAQSLRDGVYGKLEQRGVAGVRDLRMDQGSLIKMRNAAEAKVLAGDKPVAGTAPAGTARRVGGRIVKIGATAGGAAVGGPAGAVIGSEVGEAARQFIAPSNLTRDQLIERGFKAPQTSGAQFPASPAQPRIAGALGQGAVQVPAVEAQPGAPAINIDPTTRAMRKGLLLPEKASTGTIVTPEPGQSVQTAGEQASATAATKQAQTPSTRIVRDPATGKMMRQYLTAGEGKVYFSEPLTPTSKLRANASGESSASQEAINRVAQEKAAGIKRFKVDTRSGNRVPLVGVDAVDAKAGPYDVIVQAGPNGETVLDTGTKARPYKPKGRVQ